MADNIELDDLKELVKTFSSDKTREHDINDDTDFVYDLGMSSINIVSLVFMCEQKFSLALSSQLSSIRRVSTFGGLREFIGACRH